MNQQIIQTDNTKKLIQNENSCDNVSGDVITGNNVNARGDVSPDNSLIDNFPEPIQYIENIDVDIFKDKSSWFEERCDTLPVVDDFIVNAVQQ